jgi:hypothetical protein
MGDRNDDRLPDNSFRDGDPRLIDVSNPAERAYWCKSLGIGETVLVALVGKVGHCAQSVKDALDGNTQQRRKEG